MLQKSGYIEDQESSAPLEDREAIGYLNLEVSEDEESEVEDNDTEPEDEDPAGALVEGNAVEALEGRDTVGAPDEGDAVGGLKVGRNQAT